MTLHPHLTRPRRLLAALLLLGMAPLPMARSATPVPPREAKVRCAYVLKSTGKKPVGGTEEVTVRVAPNPSKVALVAFQETGAPGTREQWKTSSWVAAFCASRATDHLINDFEFTVLAREQIDGPSAGMLIAGTMMALIKGAGVLPNVTISGTINPDGSVGPVGDLYAKLLGAQKAGMRTFGYPVGCRIAYDEEARETVDLQDEARKIGIAAVEISDMYDAYTLLTGRRLLRPSALTEEKMQISTTLAGYIHTTVSEHLTFAQDRLAPLEKLTGLPPRRAEELGSAQYNQKLANIYQQQGCYAHSMLRAERAAEDAELLSLQVGIKSSSDVEVVLAEVARQEDIARKDLRDVRSALVAKMSKKTVGGKLAAFYVCVNYWQTRSYVDAANRLRTLLAQRRDRTVPAAAPRAPAGAGADAETLLVANLALRYAVRTQIKTRSLNFWLDLIKDPAEGPVAARSDEMFLQLGSAYRSTAALGIDWFKAMATTNATSRLSPEEEELYFAQLDGLDYEPALCLTRAATNGSKDLEVDEGLQPLDRLAAGSLAFEMAAAMINRTYNYPYSDGPAAIIKNRKALGRALDLSRQRVLEESSMLHRELQEVPDCIALNYELGNVGRDLSDADRLVALRSYWRCVLFSNVARTLLPDRSTSIRPQPAF